MKKLDEKTKKSLIKLDRAYLGEDELKYIRDIQIKKSPKIFPESESYLTKIFKNRKSYRTTFQNCKIDEVLEILELVVAHNEYRPTPIAGNLDFLDVLIFEPESNEYRILNISGNNYSGTVDDELLLEYLKKAVQRPEYSDTSGLYIFFMLSLDRVTCKYGTLSIPLAYSTLGCLIQNITLILVESNFLSCIHFGEKDYFTMDYKESEYTLPCFLRVGKKNV